MTIDELIAKVRDCLDGIDRTQDDTRAGYWQTADGAQFGKIILYKLEQMLRDNWPDQNFRAELQRLVTAYDEHGGRWPQEDLDALNAAVKHARAALTVTGAESAPVHRAPTPIPIPPEGIPDSAKDAHGCCWLGFWTSAFNCWEWLFCTTVEPTTLSCTHYLPHNTPALLPPTPHPLHEQHSAHLKQAPHHHSSASKS